MTTLESRVRDLRRRGVELYLEAGEIRFRAPRGALSPREKALLRERRDELREIVDAWTRRVEHLRAAPIANLIGQLGTYGFWIQVVDDRPVLRTHDETHGPVDDAILKALGGRDAEVVAFLRKSADDLRPSEFLALGYDPKCVFEGFGDQK